MRLIDADALIEVLKNEPSYSIELPANIVDYIQKLISVHQKMVVDVVKKQPTIDGDFIINYGVKCYKTGREDWIEKVVEQLEELKMSDEGQIYYDSISRTMCEEIINAVNEVVDRVINIVKAGDKND